MGSVSQPPEERIEEIAEPSRPESVQLFELTNSPKSASLRCIRRFVQTDSPDGRGELLKFSLRSASIKTPASEPTVSGAIW